MSEISLGEKIKYYRLRAKKSQLDLELETGLSTGTISRIENGNINPTKETLSRVAEVLKLKPSEVAYLLDLHIFSIYELIEAIEKISNAITSEATLQTAVDIMYDLYPNYNGGFILLPDATNSFLTVKTVSEIPNIEFLEQIINKNIQEVRLALTHRNICVQSYTQNMILQSFNMVDFTRDTLPDIVSNTLGIVLKFGSGVMMPLKYRGNVIGSIAFTKRVKQIFNNEEVKMLELLNEKIAEILVVKLHT